MPLSFGFSFYTFDKEKAGDNARNALQAKNMFTYDELIGLAEGARAGDTILFGFRGAQVALLSLLRETGFEQYVNLETKTANFAGGQFAALLDKFKNQGSAGYFQPEITSIEKVAQDFAEMQRRLFYTEKLSMECSYIFYPMDEMDVPGGMPEPGEIVGLLTDGSGRASFDNRQSLIMNANSQNKQLAWEFIKFMLSEEMQTSSNLADIPVNLAAFTEHTKLNLIKFPNYVAEGDDYIVDGYQDMTDEKFVAAYEEFVKIYTPFVDALNATNLMTDRTIREMIETETALFFEGARSAEETAAALQSRVQMYLDE
jgi:multiple sugar transport system substrate-binding protein